VNPHDVDHQPKTCPWCDEPLSDAEVEANACDSCEETLDPIPEPHKPRYMLEDNTQRVYECPTCGGEAPVFHDHPDNVAWCERCGDFDVNDDADCVGDPPRFVDRTTLSPRIPRRSLA
jgi:hypothetical protein